MNVETGPKAGECSSSWNPDRECVSDAVQKLFEQDVRISGNLHTPIIRLMRALGLPSLSERGFAPDTGMPDWALDPMYTKDVHDRLEGMKWSLKQGWEETMIRESLTDDDRRRFGVTLGEMYDLARDSDRLAYMHSAIDEAERLAKEDGRFPYFDIARRMVAVLRAMGEGHVPEPADLPEDGFEEKRRQVRERLGAIAAERNRGHEGSLSVIADAARDILRIAEVQTLEAEETEYSEGEPRQAVG